MINLDIEPVSTVRRVATVRRFDLDERFSLDELVDALFEQWQRRDPDLVLVRKGSRMEPGFQLVELVMRDGKQRYEKIVMSRAGREVVAISELSVDRTILARGDVRALSKAVA